MKTQHKLMILLALVLFTVSASAAPLVQALPLLCM